MLESDTNWELVKFKYEVLGNSLTDLANEHNLSLPVLKFNSKEWKQLPLAKGESLDLSGITSLEEILTKLGDSTARQTKAFAVLKQKFLGPKYVELETVLLHKAISMAQELKPGDPKGSLVLQQLTGVLGQLLDRNPMLAPDAEGGHSGANEWKITFVDAKESKDAT